MSILDDPSDEQQIAEYCEFVKGGKYSWGNNNLVPGCIKSYPPSSHCKCCHPADMGMYVIINCGIGWYACLDNNS